MPQTITVFYTTHGLTILALYRGIHIIQVLTIYCSLGFKNLKSRDKVFVAGVVVAGVVVAFVVDVAGVTDVDPSLCSSPDV